MMTAVVVFLLSRRKRGRSFLLVLITRLGLFCLLMVFPKQLFEVEVYHGVWVMGVDPWDQSLDVPSYSTGQNEEFHEGECQSSCHDGADTDSFEKVYLIWEIFVIDMHDHLVLFVDLHVRNVRKLFSITKQSPYLALAKICQGS
jgi:hypothetical protein